MSMTPEVPTICVVDDDPSVLRGLARLIRSAGYQVETFASATMFLATQAGRGPGCVILDLRMPGMNGLELQEAMLQAGHTGPIIFISGEGDVPATVHAMKARCVTVTKTGTGWSFSTRSPLPSPSWSPARTAISASSLRNIAK